MSAHDVDEPSPQRQHPRTDHVQPAGSNWLRALRVYLAVILIANFAWEILQLPLYSLWTTGTTWQMAFAVLHCTGGDVLIALSALTIALVVVGTKRWPAEGQERVMLVTLALGVGYTMFSEWLNIVVRSSWAYSELMPVVPIVKIGLFPLLQWIFIPTIALSLARRRAL
jgi:hypothetical protein